MARADHIFCHRFGYTNHGIDLDDGTVIHYTGESGKKANAVIRRTSLDRFSKGCAVDVRPYGSCDPPDEAIERAMSRLDENKYHLAFNNCEHFAVWCKTGQPRSEQVNDVASSAGEAVGTGTAVAAGLGTVSATGAAAGLSGPVPLPVSWTREGDSNIAPPPSIIDPDATGRSRFIGHAAIAATRAATGV